MSEELKAQLLSMLTSLTETAKSGMAFAGQQIPILIQEKIAFGRAYETINLAFAFIMFFVCVYLVVLGCGRFKVGMKAAQYDDDAYQGWLFLILPAAFGILISTIVFFTNIEPVLKVWFAPRLYIIDWLIEMSKTVK